MDAGKRTIHEMFNGSRILELPFFSAPVKGYMSAGEASYQWGVSESRVHKLCQAGRIPGRSRFGRSWAIPDTAEKPCDPRRAKQNPPKEGE